MIRFTTTSTMSERDTTLIDVGPLVAGGEALCRHDGEVVLVEGALPGERVRVSLSKARRGVRRGRVVEVLEASPERTDPPCPAVAEGCGGCRWQHITQAAQVRYKAGLVADALGRVGHFEDAPEIEVGLPLPADGARTTLRLAVRDGRLGYRRHRSHGVVTVQSCPVAHPLLDDLMRAEYGAASEVTMRCGARTGERLAVVAPDAWHVELAPDVIVVGEDELGDGFGGRYHEQAAGRRWRISAPSFFQTRPDGAEALVDAVLAACDDVLAGGGAGLVDAYCGVGLFAGAIVEARPAAVERLVAVEESPSSVADARHNLADLAAEVVQSDLATWQPVPADVVVADPSRGGLGPDAAARLAATGAERIVLVSCDAASMARDARHIVDSGFELLGVSLVDLFPHTPHVEIVSRFGQI